jgi:hypothetical protein
MKHGMLPCQQAAFLAIIVGMAGIAAGQPANDQCANAIPITEGVDYQGDNIDATGSGMILCSGNVMNDVWHVYRPKFTGMHAISLCGSEFDTVLAIYDACGGAELACNDDFCGAQSQVSWYMESGTDYYIRIAGYEGAEGNYTLSVGYDTLAWSEPTDGAVVGGDVGFYGIAYDHLFASQYTVEYQPGGGGGWQPIDPLQPVYQKSVINDYFGIWNTFVGIADGAYNVKVSLTDLAGNSAVETRQVAVDNTAPTAVIASPAAGAYLTGWVAVTGTAADSHIGYWSLQYSGGSTSGWITIASGSGSVISGSLGSWDTRALPPGAYILRLTVGDQAVLNGNNSLHNQAEFLRSVRVGLRGDINGDRAINLIDYSLMAAEWLMAY